MNRNAENRFALAPQIQDISRSKFTVPCDFKGSWQAGEVIPFYIEEAIPGSTFSVDTSKVVRMPTLISPLMSDIMMDTYYFFVPNRLLWKHWVNLCGESDKAWLPSREYTEPQIVSPENGWDFCTIADYLGIRPKIKDKVSALPFRAYAKICEDWFRSTVVQDPLNIPDGDEDQQGSNGDDYINDIANGGKPFIANKFFDVFSAATPSPQRGPNVTITLGEQAVVGNGTALGLTGAGHLFALGSNDGNGTTHSQDLFGRPVSTTGTNITAYGAYGVPTEEQLKLAGKSLSDTGLVTASGASVVTINQLREAFQIQKFYERQTSANRYVEVLKAHFGVSNGDARLQRSEYLGGSRSRINVNAVTQSSATGVTPQGNQSAYSLTTEFNSDFTKSFTEYGFVIGVVVCRYIHSYSQGIQKFWKRKTVFDRYWPEFANLGNVGIKNSELYHQGMDAINPATGKAYDDEIFGYQEAWYEYRYSPSRCAGTMRPDHPQSLDSWHLADQYDSLPHLSYEWLREDKSNIDRVIAVTSELDYQFYGDIYTVTTKVMPMPLYSIPGLIDHH